MVAGVLEITFAAGIDVSGVAADQKVDVAFAGANTRHSRFELRKDGGNVSASHAGPIPGSRRPGQLASLEASATEAYTEKVFLLYNDVNDQKSYVVSSVEIGFASPNTDDSNNVTILSNAAQSVSLFREDVARYDSNSAGLPVIFSSIKAGTTPTPSP